MTFGEKLRQTREKRGLSQQEAARALCLDTSVINALEQEKFDELPAPVFIRGYIKSYANLLNLVINKTPEPLQIDNANHSNHSKFEPNKNYYHNKSAINFESIKNKLLKPLNYGMLVIFILFIFIGWHEQYVNTVKQNNIISLSREINPFPRQIINSSSSSNFDPNLNNQSELIHIIFPEWPL